MRNWSQFKFIVNGKYTLGKTYLTANTREGNLNNIFLVNEPRVILAAQDFDDVCFRKRNSERIYTTPETYGKRKIRRLLYKNFSKTIKSGDKLFLKKSKAGQR